MTKLWTASPIKGKYHAVYGYAVVSGYGKDRAEAIRFVVTSERTAEMAYEAACDTAKLLNAAGE